LLSAKSDVNDTVSHHTQKNYISIHLSGIYAPGEDLKQVNHVLRLVDAGARQQVHGQDVGLNLVLAEAGQSCKRCGGSRAQKRVEALSCVSC
jgi:hypothetical protein